MTIILHNFSDIWNGKRDGRNSAVWLDNEDSIKENFNLSFRHGIERYVAIRLSARTVKYTLVLCYVQGHVSMMRLDGNSVICATASVESVQYRSLREIVLFRHRNRCRTILRCSRVFVILPPPPCDSSGHLRPGIGGGEVNSYRRIGCRRSHLGEELRGLLDSCWTWKRFLCDIIPREDDEVMIFQVGEKKLRAVKKIIDDKAEYN